MDWCFQNEPDAALRTVDLQLINLGGNLATGVSGTTIMVCQPNSSTFVSAIATDVLELTGDSAGSLYRFVLDQTEVQLEGDVQYIVSKPGVILPASGSMHVRPYVDGIRYGLSAGGSANNTFVLDGAANNAVNNFYAGNGQDVAITIISGTGAGQTRVASGYTASTRTLTGVTPVWAAGQIPDATSKFVIKPWLGQLDAATISAIQSPIAANVIAATVANINGSPATLKQFLVCMLAVLAGNGTGIGTGSEAFLDAGDGATSRVAGTITGGVRTTTITPP